MPILDYTVIYPPVADTAARTAIDTDSLQAGVMVNQIDTNVWYQWTGSAWAAVENLPAFTSADKYWYGGVSGAVTEGDITAAGRSILDDATAADQRTTLGLGTLATLNQVDTADITDGAITPGKLDNSSIVQYPILEDTVTWSGGLDTLEVTLTGVLATDKVMYSFKNAPTEAAYITQAVASTDTVTITLSAANTSNDAEVEILIFRNTP